MQEDKKECTYRHIYMRVIADASHRIGVKIQYDANGHWETYERSTPMYHHATDKTTAMYRLDFQKEMDVPADRDVSLQASIPSLRDWPYAIQLSCYIKARKDSLMPYDMTILPVRDFANHNGEVQCIVERDLDI